MYAAAAEQRSKMLLAHVQAAEPVAHVTRQYASRRGQGSCL